MTDTNKYSNFPPQPVVVDSQHPAGERIRPVLGVVVLAFIWLLTGVSLTLSVLNMQFLLMGVASFAGAIAMSALVYANLFEAAMPPAVVLLRHPTSPCEVSVPVDLPCLPARTEPGDQTGDDSEVISLLGDLFTERKPPQLP